MTIDDELAQLAAARGHGDYAVGRPYRAGEVAVVVDDVIAAPDEILVVRAYTDGGEPDGRNAWTEGRWQWRFRGPAGGDRTVSATRAAAFIADVHGLGPITLPSGRDIMSIFSMQQVPIPLGRDETGRHEHTVNVRVEYVDVTAHRPA